MSLHQAAISGNVEGLKTLLEAGAEINFGSPRTEVTALMLAVMHRRFKAFTILLESGADCNLVDISGNTALHLAVSNICYGIFCAH